MDIPHAVWSRQYLTYKNKIVGFAAPQAHLSLLNDLDRWLTDEATSLQAFAASVSVRLFTQKATTLAAADILALPYPETASLDLSSNEKIIVDDIVKYQRDLVRLEEQFLYAMNVPPTLLSPHTQKCLLDRLTKSTQPTLYGF